MKIVINKKHGGFSWTEAVEELYKQLSGKYPTTSYEIERNDPYLVKCIEILGVNASTRYSNLAVVEIPDDVKWHIAKYDGYEWVAEDHRTWN